MSANQATGHRKQQISGRLAWLIPGGIALLLGLDAGLLLLGLPAPLTFKRLPEVHGMLLTLGTVATLVSLERAAALGRWYGYFAPALLGVSGLALIVDPLPISYAKIGLAVGCAAFHVPVCTTVAPPTRRNGINAAFGRGTRACGQHYLDF